MPFDGVDFRPEPKPPAPATPPGSNVFGYLFLLVAFCLLAMPISAAALVDIVHYLWSK